jgi:c-di-AMP phosphodiesterase-like protein
MLILNSKNSSFIFIDLYIVAAQAILLFVSVFNYKVYTKKIIFSVINTLNSTEKNVIEEVPLPLAIISENGTIFSYNSLFLKKLNNRKDCCGEEINKFISNKNLSEILKHKGVDISFNNKRYTVFGRKIEKSIVIYFFDDTYYKMATLEYTEGRPVVSVVTFDNRNELIRNSVDGQDLQIIAKVESQLQKWSSSTSGFLKKLSSNKYLMVFEERHLRRFIAEKFKILEEIHEIKVESDIEATISIGIGRGGRNLKENELWARKALEMALGRGGDQVAIKNGASYSFFGGISKGTQNRNKVRARIVSGILTNYIKESDLALIMGHKTSDLDSLGSAIGLHSIIKKPYNKTSFIVINKKQSLARKLIEIFDNIDKNIFVDVKEAKEMINEKTLLIVVDTHNPSFLESEELYQYASKVVVIDHHRMMENHIKNAIVFYHEPNASSTSEMVTELAQYIPDSSLTKQEAQALLAGIMLDTKNFIVKTGIRTFEAAAFLKRKNADTTEVKKLFVYSVETCKEKCDLISRVRVFNNCAVTYTNSTSSEIKIIAAQTADELLDIENIRASFVVYPYDGGSNISARSLGNLNVQVLMEKIGGGGHHSTAGTQIPNFSVEKTKNKLMEILEDY